MNISYLMPVPDFWLDIYSPLLTAFPDTTIAGGALRDLNLGRQINDVDIFFSTYINNNDPTPDTLSDMLSMKVEIDTSVDLQNKKIYIEGFMDIFYTIYKEQKFQLIRRNKPCMPIHNLFGTFDIGLCMIGWHNGEYHIDDNFVNDVINMKMTVIQNHSNTKQRLDRIYLKYQDFKKDDCYDNDPTF